MRKIREVLRLKYVCGLSNVKIGKSCGISHESARQYLQRAKQAQLTWPLPKELDDEALEKLLYPSALRRLRRPHPNVEWIHQELKRKGVTLWLLWEEYKVNFPAGVGYPRFCEIYRDFKSTLTVSMRQPHRAGEKLFVDYAGMALDWIEQATVYDNHLEGSSNPRYSKFFC